MTDIQVDNPDDEFGSPAYDGPADKAHRYLEPGLYLTTEDQVLRVTENRSFLMKESFEGLIPGSSVSRRRLDGVLDALLELSLERHAELDDQVRNEIRHLRKVLQERLENHRD